MLYKGIELDISKEVHFTKSVSLSYIGQDVSYNVKYSELLSDIECRKLSPENYCLVCAFWTLCKMNYQICNGGVEQWYYNGYADGRSATHEGDCELFDKEEINNIFSNFLVPFVNEVFPEYKEQMFELASAWSIVQYQEEYEEMCSTCHGQGVIYNEWSDSDSNEECDMEELCTDCDGSGYYTEDSVIYNAERFESCLYKFENYDTILETFAQYIYKTINKEEK